MQVTVALRHRCEAGKASGNTAAEEAIVPVEELAPFSCVASAIGFTEGPLWTADSRLLVTSVSRGLVYEIDWRVGRADVRYRPGGRPTGLAEDRSGRLWLTQMEPSRAGIYRLESEHTAEGVVRTGVDSPTDCVISPDGCLWFTDPTGDPVGGGPSSGSLRCFDPTSGVLTTLAEGLNFPNGLTFDPSGRWLYVAETAAASVRRFDCAPAATGAGATRFNEQSLASAVWFELPDGRPDGLAVDRDGNVYVAATTASGIYVVSPDSRETDFIALGPGAMPTSVCFGGDGLATLFVTVPSGGRVFAIERGIPGAVWSAVA